MKMTLTGFTTPELCALMRESEQLASLLVGKTLILDHYAIGKTDRRVFKVILTFGNHLPLAHLVIFRGPPVRPWRAKLEIKDIQ